MDDEWMERSDGWKNLTQSCWMDGHTAFTDFNNTSLKKNLSGSCCSLTLPTFPFTYVHTLPSFFTYRTALRSSTHPPSKKSLDRNFRIQQLVSPTTFPIYSPRPEPQSGKGPPPLPSPPFFQIIMVSNSALIVVIVGVSQELRNNSRGRIGDVTFAYMSSQILVILQLFIRI